MEAIAEAAAEAEIEGDHSKISKLVPSDGQNDRAANGRKAARIIRGGDGSGGETDVKDSSTCSEHKIVNIGEDGRKAIDKVLRKKMDITDEQAEADAEKIKTMRVAIGWFSSPACALIYQVFTLTLNPQPPTPNPQPRVGTTP